MVGTGRPGEVCTKEGEGEGRQVGGWSSGFTPRLINTISVERDKAGTRAGLWSQPAWIQISLPPLLAL